MNNVVTILVALLGSPVVLWFLAKKFDERNTEQHANNMAVLQEIKGDIGDVKKDVKQVSRDLFNHIAYHAYKERQDGEPAGRTGQDVPTDEALFRRETA